LTAATAPIDAASSDAPASGARAHDRVGGGALVMVAALAAPMMVALTAGPSATQTARDATLGLSLGADHGGTAPIAQLLVPLLGLLPIGDLDLRAAIALSLPAAAAAALVTKRVGRDRVGGTGVAPSAIVLSFGVLAAALLSSIDLSAAIVALAIELSLAAIVAPASKRTSAFGAAIAASVVAAWTAPRLAPVAILAPILVHRARKTRGGTLARALPFVLPALAALAIIAVARWDHAFLVVGRAFESGGFARGPEEPFTAASLRTAVVAGTLAAIGLALATRKLPAEDRAAAVLAIVAAAAAFFLHASGATVVAIVALLPLAAATLGAAHIAAMRWQSSRVGAAHRPSAMRVVAFVVPALTLGFSARVVEDELRARHRGPERAAAREMVPLATLGVASPRSVLLVDDERSVLSFGHDRVVVGLRPDLRILPTGDLLLGGGSVLAKRTIDVLPASALVLNGLIARGLIEESDLSPLTERTPVLAELQVARLRAFSRHVDPSGEALGLTIERVDPSDRRLRRPLLNRRLDFVVGWLDERDPERRVLRVAATHEARILSLAGDRESALAAIVRSEALGADPERIARWKARLRAKQSLDLEPWCEDD
jgi:hypothetical protein